MLQRKYVYILLFFLGSIIASIGIDSSAATVTTKKPTREINLVYDDSGSMIYTKKKAVDTWCQAKYAMEVFACMLEPEDVLNIYAMSDYYKQNTGKPHLILKGKNGARYNVDEVHKMLTKSGGTPFKAVETAYKKLCKSEKDEKWLVVLTDGKFNEDNYNSTDEVSGFFKKKRDDIKVIYFTIGKDVTTISEDPSKDIYYSHTENNDEILNEVTSICTQIFNSNKLDNIDRKEKKISYDVPMSKLIVFAQGPDAHINGIKDAKGNAYQSIDDPVSVKYSDVAATNQDVQLKGSPLMITKDLKGAVATFEGDFPAGDYTLDVDGAKTIEVYYTPNVEIAIHLKNASGEEVTNVETLEAGEYTISFDFVKTGTNQLVPESKLLGEIDYSAEVTNNGKKHKKTYKNNDKIQLVEGGLDIDATATFLKYNSVSTSKHYESVDNKNITFTVLENPQYYVYKEGITSQKKEKGKKKKADKKISAAKPVKIKLSLDGEDITAEQWSQMNTPTVKTVSVGKYELKGFLRVLYLFKWILKTNAPDSYQVTKEKEPGIITIVPVIDGKPNTGAYVDVKYELNSYSEQQGSSWKGSTTANMKIEDERSILIIYGPSFIRLCISLAFLWLLLGFTPLFKKRFPRRMKHNPTIEGKPRPFGRRTTAHGRFTKDTLSTFLPFVPEVGTLRYVPSGNAGIPVMKLKAAGGNRVLITNVKAFAGRNDITIDGSSVPASQRKPLSKTINMTIDVVTNEMEYTLTPRA